MRILMVNPVPPSTPHISAVRAWRFSRGLAQLGHQVVLLTGSEDERDDPAASLATHDWREPLVLRCKLNLEPDRSAKVVLLRRATTAVRMLRDGGRRGRWVDEAVRSTVQSAGTFRPDVIWCTFGMLESVFAAKRIAAAVGCPWVLDVKDNWELFVPRGLRRLMSWRIKGWTAVTANSQLTAGMAAKWQAARPSLIYSGVDPDFFRGPDDVEHDSTFTLNLIGGIYFPSLLEGLFSGVRLWWDTLSEQQRSRVALRYLGSNVDEVRTAAAALLPDVALDIPGYVPVAEMARHCKRAAVNAYVAHSGTFHHKLLELLACERPTLAFPSENRESRDLAAALRGDLRIAENPQSVAQILSRIHADWSAGLVHARSTDIEANCSWPGQAVKLEQVFLRAVNGQRVEP